MKAVKKIAQQILSDPQRFFNSLRERHPRSNYTEFFINLVKDLLEGRKDVIPRSEWKVGAGPQWGLDFIDTLVQAKIVSMIVEKNKKLIMRNDNIAVKNQQFKKLEEKYKYNLTNPGLSFDNSLSVNFDHSNNSIKVTSTEHIVTWIHWEKGHGEDVTVEEQKEQEGLQVKLVKNHVEFLAKEFEEIFGSINMSVSTKRGKDGWFKHWGHTDSHKGYEFTVTLVITK